MSDDNLKNKISLFTIIQYTSFFFLFLVSLSFNVALFSGLAGDDLFSQIVFVIGTIFLEGVKVITLAKSNYAYKLHKKEEKEINLTNKFLFALMFIWRKVSHGIFFIQKYFLYIFLAFLSVFAAFGSGLVLVNKAVVIADVENPEELEKARLETIIQQKNDELVLERQKIIDLDSSIAQSRQQIALFTSLYEQEQLFTYRNQINTETRNITNFVSAKETANQSIRSINTEIANLRQQINNLKTNVSNAVVEENQTTKMFRLIGEVVSLPETNVMFALIMLFAILIEVGIFITSPEIKDEREKKILQENEPLIKQKKRKIPRRVKSFVEEVKEEPKQEVEQVKEEEPVKEVVESIPEPVKPVQEEKPKIVVEEKEETHEDDKLEKLKAESTEYLKSLFKDHNGFLNNEEGVATELKIPEKRWKFYIKKLITLLNEHNQPLVIRRFDKLQPNVSLSTAIKILHKDLENLAWKTTHP